MLTLCIAALAGLSIEVGSVMVVKGLKMALPEVARLTEVNEFKELSDSISTNSLIDRFSRLLQNLQAQSKKR